MSEKLAVILSKVPEHLSMYSTALRPQTSRFLFFSDVASLLNQRLPCAPQLIIVDNANGHCDAAKAVSMLRNAEEYGSVVTLVIVRDGDVDSGVSVLKAGASDYLSAAQVSKELAVRVGAHWNRYQKEQSITDIGGDYDNIYPEEDRLLIQTVIRHIHANLASIESVSDLACQVGYCEKDLNKVFNFHLGLTVFAYMRECRMNRAKNLLTRTRIPVAQLSLEVGYPNPANFSTAFKSVVGVSPMQYRMRVPAAALRAPQPMPFAHRRFESRFAA